jgi:acyl CoA:acetate/3-ketoacid CoA transferase
MMLVMPGVDLERDVLAYSGAGLVIPDDLPVADPSIVSGEDFELRWPDEDQAG